MAKGKSLKTLKVRVNKDGRLSKKSLEEIQGLVKPSVAEKIASRITIHDGVEAVGFAGLVALNYYGIDILGMFLGQATTVLMNALEAAVEFTEDAWSKIQGEGIVGIPTLGGSELAEIARAGQGMPTEEIKKALRTGSQADRRKSMQRQLDWMLRQPEGTFTEAEIEAYRKRIYGPRTEEEEEARTVETVKKVVAELDAKRLIIATGMAYAEKKFFESYNYSKAVENIPLVQ